MDWSFALSLLSLAVAVAVGGLAYRFRPAGVQADVAGALEAQRLAVGKALEEFSHAADEQRREYKALASEVEDLIERARHERARIDGRKGGRPPKDAEPAGPQITSREEYLRHLERGGPHLPDVERALGL